MGLWERLLEFMYVPSDGVNSTNAWGYFDKVNGAGIIVMRTILCFISLHTFFIWLAFSFHHFQLAFCQGKELSLPSQMKQFLSSQYSIRPVSTA